MNTLLKFDDGATLFRTRLATSLISRRPALFRNVRSEVLDASPGLLPHEISLLRLIDALTEGTTVEIGSTGSRLKFVPGTWIGGTLPTVFRVSGDRNLGWFLEFLLMVAPFGREALDVTLEGSTEEGCDLDPSAEYLREAVLPVLRRFGIGDDSDDDGDMSSSSRRVSSLSLRIVRRGTESGGRIRLTCPVVKEIDRPIDFTDPGKIDRIRGTAVACKISGPTASRTAHVAKGVCHRLLPDVWIHTDVHRPRRRHNTDNDDDTGCDNIPSMVLHMHTRSTTGVVLAADCQWKRQVTTIKPTKDNHNHNNDSNNLISVTSLDDESPEELGRRGAVALMAEIRKGGCVDNTTAQTIALWFMVLGPEDIGRIRIGKLSTHSVHALRLWKEVFGVEFKLRPDPETLTVVMSCLGIGYTNVARTST